VLRRRKRKSANRKPVAHSPNRAETQRAERVLALVRQALNKGRNADATRLLVAGLQHNIVSPNRDLSRWLVRHLGPETTAKLAAAFAVQSCFYCRKGRETCGECEGTGHLPSGFVCADCIGLGLAPCGFCGGSGWVTINYVPQALQYVVLSNRAKYATAQVDRLLTRRVPKPADSDVAAKTKKCAQLLLAFDRHLGALESVVTAAREIASATPARRTQAVRLAESCAKAAEPVDRRVREILHSMAELHRHVAARAPSSSAEARRAARKAEYYSHLAETRAFQGTMLERPLLRKAMTNS
jgi:hypothetical protein